MDGSSLKETYPQKYYFKAICKCMYYLGMGDCWYETVENRKKFYNIWRFISNAYLIIVVIDEILSHLRSDLDDKEKKDLLQFSISQPVVTIKILTLYYKKDRIIPVIERLVEGTRSIFYSIELEKILMKYLNRYCITLIVAVYFTLLSAIVGATITYIKEGVPIRTEVVFYPNASHTGIFVNILRFLINYHWYHMMAMMLTVDFLVLCSMITVRYKFRIVQLYYESMRINILENPEGKSRRELEEDFMKDFLMGIKLHEDALWCARNVQKSMGPIYSIQVSESVALIVVCLFELIAADHNLMYLLSYLSYITCLVMLTGAYMMAAGDITYEASMVPTAIFHCGWELVQTCPDFRVLAVVAIQRSQVPVIMTAFGVIILSYTNFISVLRSSYSFFAVMY